jgi:limonene-1,2-epoxide hydrolase
MLEGMSLSPVIDVDHFVRSFIAAIEANDLDTACSMLSDDCVYDNVPMGPITGPHAVRAGLAPFLGACDQIDWQILHQVARQDGAAEGVVMNERLDRFHLGNRWVEVPVAGLFVISDGLVTLWRDYFDLATYRDQMSPPT